jgi:hypothetical protein
MRKTIKMFAIMIILIAVMAPAIAQEQVRQNIFKVNLISPLVRTGSFFYERVLNEDMSVQLGVFYTGASIDVTEFRGLGITPEFRYYLSESKPAPSGVFIAPYLRYQNFNLSEENSIGKATYSGIGGGLLVGTQRLLKNTISLEGFIGPSYFAGNLKVTDGQVEDFDIDFFDGFGVRFGFTVGIAF